MVLTAISFSWWGLFSHFGNYWDISSPFDSKEWSPISAKFVGRHFPRVVAEMCIWGSTTPELEQLAAGSENSQVKKGAHTLWGKSAGKKLVDGWRKDVCPIIWDYKPVRNKSLFFLEIRTVTLLFSRTEDKGVFLYGSQGADMFIVFKINVNLVGVF